MACNCHDDRLFQVLVEQELPDCLSCIVPVHHWHVAVHQNQFVRTAPAVIKCDVLLYLLDGFKTMSRNFSKRDIKVTALKDDLESFDVKALVVDN